MYTVDNSGFDDGWGQNLLNIEYGVFEEVKATGVTLSTYSEPGGVPGYADTPWNRDMNRLFRQLREVTNNGPDSVGGGGQPRQPLAPPFR